MLKRPFFFLLLILQAGFFFAQEGSSAAALTQYSQKFQNGTLLYRQSRWNEAASEFIGARDFARNAGDLSETLYWGIMSQLACADFNSAFRYMDELEKITPYSGRSVDIIYHRARVLYSQSSYEEAMLQFIRYSESVNVNTREAFDRKAASLFWAGESLYSLGQMDRANEFYEHVVTKFPSSPKAEVASYKIELIRQKKIEAELLSLLRWSHEEALRNNEDFQRKLRTYENTINSYHKRIADLGQDSRVSDLEETNAEYQRRLFEAEEKIVILESDLAEFEKREKESLLQKAKQLKNDLQWDLDNISGGS